MSFLQSLAAAFKGESPRVPLARTFTSPWVFADGGGTRAPFEYAGAVKRAYLDNPVAQRAVRLVAEGIGGAPLLPAEPELTALVSATSAGQSLLETLAAYLFDVPVRFAEDRLEISGAAFAAGEAPSVPVIEIREAA